MAVATTYRLDSANLSSFGATSLVGAQDFSITTTADEVLTNSDGFAFTTGAYIDNISFQVVVTGIQNNKTLAIGDTGTLTLKGAARALGEGNAVGTITYTSGTNAAVLTSIEDTIGHAGSSTYKLTFRCVSVDGSATALARS